MQYLISINSLVMVLFGCTSLPFPNHYGDGTGESIIYNQSGHDIRIKGSFREVSRFASIKNNGEKKRTVDIYKTSREEAASHEFFGVTNYSMGSDSVRITFDCMDKADRRCLKYVEVYDNDKNCQVPRSPYCIDAYAVTRLGDRSFRYEYTFTEDDYNRAKPCPCDEGKKEETTGGEE